MTKTGYLKRYRHPMMIIKFAVLLHIFLQSRIVEILMYFLFRSKVTYKTVCDWTKKFGCNVDAPSKRYSKKKVLICNVDEKYVKVKGEWDYWWSIKDCFGNVIHSIVTGLRDFASAKKLFIEVREKIGRDVDILIRDGLPAYDKATKYLGRKCKSVVSGIQGKPILFKNKFYWITNNPSESLNSEIDFYLAKFQNNFANLESANRFANLFMLRKRLKKCFAEKKLSEASSLLVQAINI